MKYSAFILFFFIFSSISCAQNKSGNLYVAHWNVENLFDTADDLSISDEEFLPGGSKEWSDERLEKKMYNISRVIRSMNYGQGPDLLGLCEVENEGILRKMTDTFLPDYKFGIVYIESPDSRGIDNALIFDSRRMSLLKKDGLKVDLDSKGETRLILYASLLLNNADTLHVYVNHWPSRRGGEKESQWRRIAAAKVLRNSVDELLMNDPRSRIFILGDFNDEPLDESIMSHLKAQPIYCDSVHKDKSYTDISSDLFNLSYESWSEGHGSFMYREDFNMLDQIIISRELLTGDKITYACGSFEVFNPYFMVTTSGKFKDAPFPTFGGSRYLGGYSDHFPVTAKFNLFE